LAGNLLFILSLGIGLLFAFHFMTPGLSISDQWSLYVNPFNNLFLYVMGIAIFYNFREIQISRRLNFILLIISLLLFCFLPYQGNQSAIISGHGRVVFVFLSFMIVLCFYKMNVRLPGFLSLTLGTFGMATYGVYLVHPIVYYYVVTLMGKLNIQGAELIYISVAVITVFISVLSYKWFELKMIKLGKKLTT
jgi:peptidoglycan/LPS O-acetylase OafA/YrhL